MSWDYLDDAGLPSRGNHHIACGNWEYIDVQLQGEEFVSLTREEWRRLRGLMAKRERGELEARDMGNMSPELSRVLSDWFRIPRGKH